MVDEPIFYARIGMEYTVCEAWRDAALEVINDLEPDVVLMGGASSYDFSQSQWVEGTGRVLERVAPVAQNVFIIAGTPRLPFDGPGCISRREWQPAFLIIKNDCSAPLSSKHENEILAWLKDASRNYKNVVVVDLNPLICPNGRCYAELNGEIVFRDSQHLSARYVEKLSDRVAHLVDEARF